MDVVETISLPLWVTVITMCSACCQHVQALRVSIAVPRLAMEYCTIHSESLNDYVMEKK